MTEPMREPLHESLSAAIDDEAEELELRRVLNALRDEPELRAKWRRMHMIQDVIRGGTAQSLDGDEGFPWADVADGDAAPNIGRGRWRRQRRWLGPLTGAAIATAAALTVVLYFGDTDNNGPTPTAVQVAQDSAKPARALAQTPTQLDLQRANAYLLQHAQHSAATTRPAAMPFAKVLTTPSSQPLRDGDGRPQ